MEVTEHEQTFDAFDKEKVKGFSICLLVLGCVKIVLNLSSTNILGVFGNAVPIAAGIVGLVSSKQPSKILIVAFMVLGIISAVIGIVSALFFALILASFYQWAILLAVIFVVILNVAQAGIGAYCSFLASKQVGACGLNSENQQFEGVVHGKMYEEKSGEALSVANAENTVPVDQYNQIHPQPCSPPGPPTYNQATLQL